eukprot:NODE_3741_length_736_cov_114.170306_g2143_i1.p2 GENE.NODE_3741_length_736_cov_114.170306_g2143_i1~~NODE_3741_length_736_cov_114.170306_g2143_i1.p2  ORF type:complete len:155 (-),score=20.16 NODE_3741_length_736_cov_114.170306_g2143_i1:3-467(-)
MVGVAEGPAMKDEVAVAMTTGAVASTAHVGDATQEGETRGMIPGVVSPVMGEGVMVDVDPTATSALAQRARPNPAPGTTALEATDHAGLVDEATACEALAAAPGAGECNTTTLWISCKSGNIDPVSQFSHYSCLHFIWPPFAKKKKKKKKKTLR